MVLESWEAPSTSQTSCYVWEWLGERVGLVGAGDQNEQPQRSYPGIQKQGTYCAFLGQPTSYSGLP